MAYKKANTNSFADYQMGEGFSHAVSGDPGSHGMAGFNPIHAAKRLGSYTSVPGSYAGMMGNQDFDPQEVAVENALGGYERFGNALDSGEVMKIAADEALGSYSGGHLTRDSYEVSRAAKQGALLQSDSDASYYLGGLGEDQSSIADLVDMQPEDDAFAGYVGGVSESEAAFDGYGSSPDTPLESFHTFLHKAANATTGKQIIQLLAKGVETVSETTPASVREDYYNKAKEMLQHKKATQLPALDVRLAEIESNIGWLINPELPKSGGFRKLLHTAIPQVTQILGEDDPYQKKLKKKHALAKRAKKLMKKRSGLDGFGEGGNKVKYFGLGIVGLVAAGLAWHFFFKKEEAPAPAKRRKRSRKK